MSAALLLRLEEALRRRNPQLVARFQPGIPERRIRRVLERAAVGGATEPIITLFSWKNGMNNDCQALSREQASPFPKSIYVFKELDAMLADFMGFEECLTHHPEYGKVVGRFFPLFWDCSNSWLTLDLEPSGHSRIVLLHTEFEQMAFEMYGSFEEFLSDAILANEEDDKLSGFDELKPLSL